MRPFRAGARAFTLIELLVVVALVALLIGILLPAVGAARRAGIATRCLSNVRQLELAHVLYLNDHREAFVDAGLPHGGPGAPRTAWPVALEPYYGSDPVIRSPGDRSPFWPIAQGGAHGGLTLAQVLEMIAQGQTPQPTQVARWTSYGLNSFTTRFAQPSIQHPTTGRWLGPWDTLARIDRPWAVVHFLQMTEGLEGDPGGFARSDHVHPEDWGLLGAPGAPAAAAAQMETNAHGGPRKSWEATATYGFIDGHAATLPFKRVYRDPTDNSFCPDFAR